MDRDDVTSVGLTAIGIVAGTLARAVALGGRLVAAGLGTLENALRGGDDAPAGPREEFRPAGRASEPAARSSFAPVSEPAFEPADGVTAPARRAGAVTRRSSADAASRATPGPRPAKRATAKSLPPNLRPVGPRTTAPVKGAAGAADPAPDAEQPAADGTAARTGAAEKTTAKKATAKKATAKKTTAGTAAAKKTSTSGTTAAERAAKKTTGTKATTRKAPAKKAPSTPPTGAPDAGGDGSPAT